MFVWQSVGAWHQRRCWQKWNGVSCSLRFCLSFKIFPPDAPCFLCPFLVDQLWVISPPSCPSSVHEYAQAQWPCPAPPMVKLSVWKMGHSSEGGSIVLNEGDQTKSGEDREEEAGCWILMISLGGGIKGKGCSPKCDKSEPVGGKRAARDIAGRGVWISQTVWMRIKRYYMDGQMDEKRIRQLSSRMNWFPAFV